MIFVGTASAFFGVFSHLVHHILHCQAFLRLTPDIAVRSAGAHAPIGVEGFTNGVGQGRSGEAHNAAHRRAGGPDGSSRNPPRRTDGPLSSGGHITGLHGLHGCGIGEDAGQKRTCFLCHRIGRDQHDGLGKIVHGGASGYQHQLRLIDHRHEDQKQPHDDDAAEHAQELDDERIDPLPGFPAPIQRPHRQHGRRDDIQEKDVEHPCDQGQEDGEGVVKHGDAHDEGNEIIESGKTDIEIAVDDLEGIVISRVIQGFLSGVVGKPE